MCHNYVTSNCAHGSYVTYRLGAEQHANIPFPLDVRQLLRPQRVWARLYVIKARNLTPMDSSNTSDPFVQATLGDHLGSRLLFGNSLASTSTWFCFAITKNGFIGCFL